MKIIGCYYLFEQVIIKNLAFVLKTLGLGVWFSIRNPRCSTLDSKKQTQVQPNTGTVLYLSARCNMAVMLALCNALWYSASLAVVGKLLAVSQIWMLGVPPEQEQKSVQPFQIANVLQHTKCTAVLWFPRLLIYFNTNLLINNYQDITYHKLILLKKVKYKKNKKIIFKLLLI